MNITSHSAWDYMLLVMLSMFSVTFYAQNSPWILEAESIDQDEYYGITVANGMVGLVSSPHPMKLADVVLNGVFDRYGRGRVENILKVFDHLNMEITVDGVVMNVDNMENHRQYLDMKRSVLFTEFDFRGVHVVHGVRSLRHLPFCQLVEVQLSAEKDAKVRISNRLETPSHLRSNQMFFNEIIRPHAEISIQTSVAESPTGRHRLAASSSFILPNKDGHHTLPIRHEEWDEGAHFQHFTKKLAAGESYSFGLVGSTLSSEHVQDPHNEAERMVIYGVLEGMERLIDRHEEAWTDLWRGDIVIEGNVDDQREVRSALYHLYSFVRAGSGYSMSPMGLSGLGYNGHVFWDTEIWMYPPLLVFHPDIARSILDYRYDRMEAAKKNALMHGYQGAMYPWESAEDGSEQTPVWAITGPFEHHITGDVAWAAWQYYLVTGDKEWLAQKGYPIIKETADYWCSRVERDGPGAYHIRNVVCADEYAENVDDNAFTNAVAILNLQYADQAAKILGHAANPDWNVVSKNIPILTFENGVTQEHASYRGEVIKQADVNLLAHPLYFIRDKNQIIKDLKYYEPKYDELGPAMGFCTLATLHAQVGDVSKAYDLWHKSFLPNKVPPFGVLSETKGGTNPYFATGAGGMLQTVLWGFGGLRIENQGIQLGSTNLPESWEKLTLKGVYGKE